MQFDTTINRWHPCKNTARINASNPCSEYMFLDDSACNLSSLNLMKFVGPDGQFDVDAFRHAVDTLIMAQEILVDNASYPTEKIAQEFARLPPARPRLRQSGRAADVVGHPLRQRPRPRLGRRHQRHHVRPGLSHQRPHRRSHRPVPRLREERRAVPRSHPHAPRLGAAGINSRKIPHAISTRAREQCWDDAYELGKQRRLPQRAR